jgi:serine/threonine protein kinase
MHKVEEEEIEVLTDKRSEFPEKEIPNQDEIKKSEKEKDKDKEKLDNKNIKKIKKNRNRKEKSEEKIIEVEKETLEAKQKSLINSDQFNINNRYHLIKMLGFGSFGEIHLAYDSQTKLLNAIKFELITQKNPQLKHEFNILEQLNKSEGNINNNSYIEGIPRVYMFDRMENKANFMIMEFLGPALSGLFQFKNKVFSLTTVLLIGIQMLQRIEFIHEKGFIHRDIKPENFVVGLNEKSNTIYTIDYGLSKRYKDKNTGQHVPYKENRHLIGTARYASLNAHLGIEQSRRDDMESIGYVLVYFLAGRLPWQSKQEKAKLPQKIMEKKLITPPEVLCKNLPSKYIK